MAEEYWWVPGPQLYLNPDIANMSLMDVRQAATGTKVIRIYSLYCFFHPTQVNNGAAGGNNFVIARISGPPQPGTIGIFPCKSTNTPLPNTITAGTGRSYSETAVFRQIIRQLNIWSASLVPSDAAVDWAMDIPMGLVWGTTKQDQTLQPITVRAGEGFHIRQKEAMPAGGFSLNAEVDMEFGVADS